MVATMRNFFSPASGIGQNAFNNATLKVEIERAKQGGREI